ncbi:MAG: hypothetical protein ACRDH0_00720 [Actinomycetota bacterium]
MAEKENREFEVTVSKAKLPRPVPDGTEHIESLGHLIDNLMGDARIRKAVERELEPLYLKEDGAPEDPPPVELPEPVPGGTEEIVGGGKPGEKRG